MNRRIACETATLVLGPSRLSAIGKTPKVGQAALAY